MADGLGEGVRVGRSDEFPEGGGREVEVGGHALAVFRADGRLFAVDNTCPHRGGPLAEGAVVDGCVACPWHGWRFDLSSGVCQPHPGKDVARHHVEERDGEVLIFPGG